MSTNKIQATIKGISPVLMHRYPLVPVEGIDKKEAVVQAEYAAYRIPEGQHNAGELYIPGIAIQRALVNGASYSKGKGRASLVKQVAACVLITPEYCSIGTKNFEVDSRPVRIAATKGTVVRHRPRINDWSVSFTIEYDDTLLKATEVRRIVDDTGSRVGLLDFRPEKKGPFGRFIVTKWE